MAKKRGRRRVSKSQKVRDYLDENPMSTPKEIVTAMRERGVKISNSLAANVKYGARPAAGGRRKIGKRQIIKKKVPAGRRGGRTAGVALSADDLFEAKKLVEQVGGIGEARKALDALEQLQ